MNKNILCPEAESLLRKYFVFDQFFDLLQYDSNMAKLYNDLKALTRQSYEPNYRFIFLLYDTEYYVNHDSPGLTLLNLQNILESLDIDNYFCILLTQQNLQSVCRDLQKNYTTNNCSIAVFENFLHKPFNPPTDVFQSQLNVKSISKKYVSLNKVTRFHRRILVALLKYKNLLRFGMVSYHGN
jgi:hypothetical protein